PSRVARRCDVELAARPAAPGGGPVGSWEGGAVAPFEAAEAAPRGRRARRPVDLPLLRGRLRPARLRQGRGRLAHRGRPGEPDLPRTPLPEGPGVEVVRPEPAARVQGQVPAALRHRLAGALA